MVKDYLGVTLGLVLEKFKANRGAHFCLSWLRDMSKNLIERSMYEGAARVYIFHLVRCIILVDKSHVYIDARYICMLSDFDRLDCA